MKDYIIPYIVGDHGDWWGGVDVYNHNAAESAITIKIFRNHNGVMSKSLNQVVPAYGHYILLPEEINKGLLAEELNKGRATIIITGPEGLMLTAYQGCKDEKGRTTGFGILNIFEDTNLKK